MPTCQLLPIQSQGKVHLFCGSWSGAKFFIRDIRQANSGLFHFSENHQDLLPKGWHFTDKQRSLRCQLASPSQSNRTNMGHIYHKDEWICTYSIQALIHIWIRNEKCPYSRHLRPGLYGVAQCNGGRSIFFKLPFEKALTIISKH